MEKKLEHLKRLLLEIDDLTSAARLLEWDQHTYMPAGGSPARARQFATLQRLAHEKFTSVEIGRLLDDLRPYEEGLPYDSDHASLIRVTRRDFEQATQVPADFVAQLSDHTSLTAQVWRQARPADDFNRVRPYLEKTVDLSRQMANFFPGYEHIADPLIDFSDHGMKVSTVQAVFAELREVLVPLVQAIGEQEPVDDACLHQTFPEDQQWAFGVNVIQHFGYDFQRGRQDLAPHPFTTSFSIGDVRVTTRINPAYLGDGIFGTMHESGHAMYEQGIDPAFEGTPLASGTSSGVHESQSRLWENVVGRSRGFWQCFYPQLQEVFPGQLKAVPLETFYRAINRVQPSLIRVEADEVTYNLHVLLRFDLELALLEGKLAVGDLPDAWRERFQADLGIAPPNDRDGVLQDVHWYFDRIGGGFQGYTLGNIMAAQFFERALQDHPEIPDQIERGEFGTLHTWLREHIYHVGRKFTPAELLERVVGGPLSIEPYARYLRDKYGELYDL